MVIDQALPALGADAGVMLLVVDGGTLEPVVVPGGDGPPMGPVALDDSSPFGEVAATAQSLWIETPGDLRGRYASWATPGWSEAGALAVIPLIAEGRVLGVLGFRFDVPQPLPIADRAFMLVLAQQSAAVLERVHLYEQVRQAAALQERNRLARDLHDSVSQALYAIILAVTAGKANLHKDLGRVERALDNVQVLTGAAQADLRALLFDLRDDSIKRNGLVNALLERAQFLRQRHGLAVTTSLCEEPALGAACKEALYGIAREALHNALKHARANQVGLRLAAVQGGLRLEIADDGIGFEPGHLRPGHYGLQSMRERALELGARFDLDTGPGQGTRVTVFVPFAGDTDTSPHQPPCANGGRQ